MFLPAENAGLFLYLKGTKCLNTHTCEIQTLSEEARQNCRDSSISNHSLSVKEVLRCIWTMQHFTSVGLDKSSLQESKHIKGSTFKKHDVHCPQGVSTMEGPMQQCYSGKCGSPLTSDRFSRKQRWRISTLCKSKWTPDEKYSTPSAYQIQF